MKQNNIFKRTLSAVLLFLASSLAWAYDFEQGSIYYNINEDGETMEVTSHNSDYPYNSESDYVGSIVIPATVSYEGKTYRVTSIGDYAFQGCSSLTSVNIPDGVTYIGTYTFWNCSSLTSINIPASVTSIGNSAFRSCTSLAAVNIPEGVASIGTYAFYYCSALTSIVIPDGVTSIGERAFEFCSSLTSVTIGDGVTSIGNYAFQNCRSLTTVTIGKGVTNISSYIFNSCTSLTAVICRAENVPEIGYYIFNGVSKDKVTLYVPASALEAYKAADQWKDFGTILTLDDLPAGIGSPTLQDKAANAPYYTLDGKRVVNPTRKGIYIRNGKKTIMK